MLLKIISYIIDDEVTATRLSSIAMLTAHKYFDYEKNMKKMTQIQEKMWIFEENVFQTKDLQQISPGGSTVKA